MRKWITYLNLPGLQISRFDRWIILILFFCGVFGDFIANDKPLIYQKDGRLSMPIIADYMAKFKGKRTLHQDWHHMDFEFVIRAPIPYSASYIDLKNAKFRSPFSQQEVKNTFYRHWLGTDGIGRDVLAGLIRGCRIALIIGFISTLFALVIGIPAGTMMGYWGNQRIKTSRIGCISSIILGSFILIVSSVMIQLILKDIFSIWNLFFFFGIIGVVLFGIYLLLEKRPNLHIRKRQQIPIPIDLIGMRIIEILRSIPGLFLILACLGLMIRPSMVFVGFLIGFIRWPTIARYVRAEVLKIKSVGYVQSAETLGLSESRLVFRHLLPNAISPVLVTVAFGFSSAVLVESALSFLGLGLGIEEMSWGKLLNQARSQFDAWWLVLFPGLMIFLTVYVFNRVGDQIGSIIDPRLNA